MDLLTERRINYRELQGIAKKMNLPGNLKYNLLVEVIRARKEGKEHVVERILGEQKMERVRRKHEKLGSQESAYQHLRMAYGRGSSVMMPRKYPITTPPNINVSSPPPNENVGNMEANNMQNVPTHQSANNSNPAPTPWAGVTNLYATDVRTVLQMPRDVLHNLYRKANEERYHQTQEAYRRNPPLAYGEWLKGQQGYYIPEQQTYMQESSPPIGSEPSKEYFIETEAVSPNEEHKKSYQVKDIINGCGSYQNCGTYGVNSSHHECNQLPCDVPLTSFSETFVPPFPGYLPNMNPWRNIYPDATFAQAHYADYCIQTDPASCASEVSPNTSDTVSVTEEDLPKENAYEISMPLQQSYDVSQRQIQLSSLQYEEPSTSNVQELPSTDEDNQIEPLLTPESDEIDSSETSLIVINHAEGFQNKQGSPPS